MRTDSRKKYIISIIVLFYISVLSSANATPPYSEIVIFGDSLSDPGNAFVLLGEQSTAPYTLIPSAPYARGGLHFTNGETWIEQVAKTLNNNTGPAWRVPQAFLNYAVGGSRARARGNIHLTTQVGLFLSQHNQIPEDALYVVFIGGNDLLDAANALLQDNTGATSKQIINDALLAVHDNLTALSAAGARHFLIVNGPDVSLVPAVRLFGDEVAAYVKLLSAQFNLSLVDVVTDISAMFPIEVKQLDVFALFNNVVAQSEVYGFADVTDTCLTFGVKENAVCNKPDSYLFWDGIHPTRAGHELIAKQALQILTAP